MAVEKISLQEDELSAPLTTGWYVYLVAMIAAMGGFLFGYDLSIISGAILYLKNVFGLNDVQEGFAMASAVIGCMLGSFLISALGDPLGRKKTLFLSAALYGVGAIGTAFPGTITEFNIYRAVGGLGVALSSVISPMYIAEIAPARMRGRLVTVNQLAIMVGCFAAALVSYALATSSIAESWRWMFASACLPVALLMIGLFFVPESPRWLLQKGRRTEALEIVKRIEGTDALDTAALLDPSNANEETGSYRDLLRPAARMGLVVAVGLAVFQQLTGASILFANAPVVFQRAGFYSEHQAIGQSVVLQIWCIVCTVASMWLVDRIGRRPLLLVGLSAMMLGQIATGLAFQSEMTGPLVVVILLFAIGSYIISLAPLAWLIMSEMFPTSLRSKGMAVASLTLWIAYFVGLQLFPVLRGFFLQQSGTIAGVFYCFAAVCAIALVFSLKVVPETKGRTLEEISDSWGARPLH